MLFSNVEQLIPLNSKLCAELAGLGKTESVGSILCRFAPLFELYHRYAMLFSDGAKALTPFKRHQEYLDFSTEAGKDERIKGLSLESLLITPVQRVPRYKMLLSEIRKNKAKKDPR